jgi:hemoglobin
MTKLWARAILVLGVKLAVALALAQEEKANPDVAGNRALDERFNAAVQNRDLAAVMACYSKSDSVTSVDPTGKKYRGPVEVRANWQQFIDAHKAIKMTNFESKFSRLADGLVAGHGIAEMMLTPNEGKPYRIAFDFTDVRRKEGGKWVYLYDRVTVNDNPTAGDPLYKRLGGYDAIAAVVDDFVPRLVSDATLKRFFGGLSADSGARVRQHLVDQVCNVTGGPCLYTGRDMKVVHTGMSINAKDWDIMAKHFVATLDKFQVGKKEKEELLNIVGTLKGQIVEKQ